jgi:hypothetical protein
LNYTFIFFNQFYFVFSGLKIIGHRNPDSNLESRCTLLHRVKTRPHFFPPLHSHFASFPSLYLLSDLTFARRISGHCLGTIRPEITFRPVVTVMSVSAIFTFSPLLFAIKMLTTPALKNIRYLHIKMSGSSYVNQGRSCMRTPQIPFLLHRFRVPSICGASGEDPYFCLVVCLKGNMIQRLAGCTDSRQERHYVLNLVHTFQQVKFK